MLIVDDSRTIRGLIRARLEQDPRLIVVAEAETAREARDAVNAFKPDVMTLDVEMPSMSGLEFLDRVMKHRPMPVVMVSTLTRSGSATAIEALAKGAIECVEKPSQNGTSSSFSKLADILVEAANADPSTLAPRGKSICASQTGRSFNKICLIGGSTGAVDVIEQILLGFPKDCPPTVITQHMPAPFLSSFAARLDPLVQPKVKLAEDGEPIETGKVLVAPGGDFHVNLSAGPIVRAVLTNAPPMSGHRPSVDSMFKSAIPIADRVVATILTGMGKDGAAGLAELKLNGAKTFGQSSESCVVFGMPRVAGEFGAVSEWAAAEDLSGKLLNSAEATKRIAD